MLSQTRLATIVCALSLCALLMGFGPLASTRLDAEKALEAGKRLRIKADAPDEAKAIWEQWLLDRPKRIEGAKATEKEAKERLRVAKAGNVGKHAVEAAKRQSKFEQTVMDYEARQQSGSDDPGLNNAFIGTQVAGFVDKAAKDKCVAGLQVAYDKAKDRLDGLQKGTLIEVPSLFMAKGGRSKGLADMKVGMIGTVGQIKVTDVDEQEFFGYVSYASDGAENRLCVFTNCDTEGLLDGAFLEDGFTVIIDGIREVSMYAGGAVVKRRLFVLKACSFYEWLEEDTKKTDKIKVK